MFLKLKYEFNVIVSNICAEFFKINKNSIQLKFVVSGQLPFAWRRLDIVFVKQRNQVKYCNKFRIKFHFIFFDRSNFFDEIISFNILDSDFF